MRLGVGATDVSLRLLDRHWFFGPHPEAFQCVRAERVTDWHIDRVTPPRYQHAADPWRIVAWVEDVPGTIETGFEPGREIHGIRGWRNTDVAKVTGAVSRGNVHASAKCHGKMHEIAAHATPFVERLPRGSSRTSVCIVECDVVVAEVADRLHAAPAHRRMTEQLPRDLRQSVR